MAALPGGGAIPEVWETLMGGGAPQTGVGAGNHGGMGEASHMGGDGEAGGRRCKGRRR